MDEFKMPESSARACVNVAKSNSIGLIWYCKEDDSFELDAEAVDEFYDNMDVLLSRNARENKRIKELEKELSEIRNSYYRQKKTLDRYIKVYGEDVMNFVSMRKEFRIGMYIPVPICLLNSRFSSTTLLVYGSLLNRALLSQKNDWQNDYGEVFVRFSIDELAKYVGKGIS